MSALTELDGGRVVVDIDADVIGLPAGWCIVIHVVDRHLTSAVASGQVVPDDAGWFAGVPSS